MNLRLVYVTLMAAALTGSVLVAQQPAPAAPAGGAQGPGAPAVAGRGHALAVR